MRKMKRVTCGILALLLAFVSLSFLAGCQSGPVITVYNWGEYISTASEGGMDVNREFTRQTGIRVNYVVFQTNEELYAKLVSGGSDFDVIVPSDYMVGRLVEEGYLEKLNFDNIPNYANIDPVFSGLSYDPENEYSVPYFWGTVGIYYNVNMVDPADIEDVSWDILWDDKYADSILMFDNPRDAFFIALKKLGYSINTTDEGQLLEALELLREQKPLVQAYVMDQIYNKMGNNEAALAPYYSGDGIQLIEDNPDIAYVVPKEGTNLFIDAMCIVKGSKNKEAAEQYINFMCSTEVSVANAEYVGYATPNMYARDELDPEIVNDTNYYPSAEFLLKNAEIYKNLPPETNKLIDRLWIELKK